MSANTRASQDGRGIYFAMLGVEDVTRCANKALGLVRVRGAAYHLSAIVHRFVVRSQTTGRVSQVLRM